MIATRSSRVPLGRSRCCQVVRMAWATVRTVRSTTWILLILAAGMKFLPEVIAENSLAAVKPVAYSLMPWAGLGLLCLYAVRALGVGGWLMIRRDA